MMMDKTAIMERIESLGPAVMAISASAVPQSVTRELIKCLKLDLARELNEVLVALDHTNSSSKHKKSAKKSSSSSVSKPSKSILSHSSSEMQLDLDKISQLRSDIKGWTDLFRYAAKLPLLEAYKSSLRVICSSNLSFVLKSLLDWLPQNSIEHSSERVAAFRLSSVEPDPEEFMNCDFDRFLILISSFDTLSGSHCVAINLLVHFVVSDLVISALRDYRADDAEPKIIESLIATGFTAHSKESGLPVNAKGFSNILEDNIVQEWKGIIRFNWSMIIGLLSQIHLDDILSRFSKELLKYNSESVSYSVDASLLIDAVSLVRIYPPSLEDHASAEIRLLKLVNLLSVFIDSKKKGKTNIAEAVWNAFTKAFSQARFPLLPEKFDSVLLKAIEFSKISQLKGLVRSFIVVYLVRCTQSTFSSHFQPFYSRCILKNIKDTKKLKQSFDLLLQFLRGTFTQDALYSPYLPQLSVPYSFVSRTDENLPIWKSRFDEIVDTVFKSKVLVSSSRFLNVLVEIVLQMAVHDAAYVTENVLLVLLSCQSFQPEKAVLALKCSYRLLNKNGAFLKFCKCAPHLPPKFNPGSIFDSFAVRASTSVLKLLDSSTTAVGLKVLGHSPERLPVLRADLNQDDFKSQPTFSSFGSESQMNTKRLYSRAASIFGGSKGFLDDSKDEGSDDSFEEGFEETRSPSSLISLSSIESTRLDVPTPKDDFNPFDFDPSVIQKLREIREDCFTQRIKQMKISSEDLKLIDVLIFSVRFVSVHPLKQCFEDSSGSLYIPTLILHPNVSLAMETSFCLQRVSTEYPSLFPTMFRSFCKDFIKLFPSDVSSIVSILQVLEVCVRLWSDNVKISSLKDFELCVSILEEADAFALVHLCHSSCRIRKKALDFSRSVRRCFETIARNISEESMPLFQVQAMSKSRTCLASAIEDNSDALAVKSDKRWRRYQREFYGTSSRRDSIRVPSLFSVIDGQDDSINWCSCVIEIIHLLNSNDTFSQLREASRSVLLRFIMENIINQFPKLSEFEESGKTFGSCAILVYSAFLAFKPALTVNQSPDIYLTFWNYIFHSSLVGVKEDSTLAVQGAHQFRIRDLIQSLSDWHDNSFKIQTKIPSESFLIRLRYHNRFLTALSSPLRLREILGDLETSETFFEVCRQTNNDAILRFAGSPLDFASRCHFIRNVAMATSILRTNFLVEKFGYFTGPYIPTKDISWSSSERLSLCEVLREWCNIGTTHAEDDLLEQQMMKANAKRRSTKDVSIDNFEEELFASHLQELRDSAYQALSHVIAMGPVFNSKKIALNWVDWALAYECPNSFLLSSILCHHFDFSFPRIWDHYFQVSMSSPTSKIIFHAITSQLAFADNWVNPYSEEINLKPSPFTPDPEEFCKRFTLIGMSYFASLVCFALLHIGSESQQTSLLAHSFLCSLYRLVDVQTQLNASIPPHLIKLFQSRQLLESTVHSTRLENGIKVCLCLGLS